MEKSSRFANIGLLGVVSCCAFAWLCFLGLVPRKPHDWSLHHKLKLAARTLWIGFWVGASAVLALSHALELVMFPVSSTVHFVVEFITPTVRVVSLIIFMRQIFYTTRLQESLNRIDSLAVSWGTRLERSVDCAVLIAAGFIIVASYGAQLSWYASHEHFYVHGVHPILRVLGWRDPYWSSVFVHITTLLIALNNAVTRTVDFAIVAVATVAGRVLQNIADKLSTCGQIREKAKRATAVDKVLEEHSDFCRELGCFTQLVSTFVALTYLRELSFVLLLCNSLKMSGYSFASVLTDTKTMDLACGILRTTCMICLADKAVAAVPILQSIVEKETDSARVPLLFVHLHRMVNLSCCFTAGGVGLVDRTFAASVVGAIVTFALVMFEMGEKAETNGNLTTIAGSKLHS